MKTTIALFALLTLSLPALANPSQQSIQLNLDLLWIVVAGILVFFMQAGFGLIECGMSRSKNAVNVIMKNYTDICLGTIVFYVMGYGLMFGDFPLFSDFESGMQLGHLFFQTMFAATAVTIASGAMAERTRFTGYLIGAIFIFAIIYPVYGGFVWGSAETIGWLARLGFIDFAGSTVVHSIGGWCALAGIIVVGPRLGRFLKNGEVADIPGHNIMYIALGGFILWFGWFAFNAGSTLESNQNIALIAYNTQIAAAAGALGIFLYFSALKHPLYASKIINGSLAGLVSITAGCATMTPIFAMITGLLGALLYIFGEKALLKLKLDDVVGAVSVHGFCGCWGTLAAGLFFAPDMFNIGMVLVQLLGIIVGFLWAFPLAFACFTVIEKTIGLRSSSYDQRQGLDYTEHSELGYPEFQQNKLFDDR